MRNIIFIGILLITSLMSFGQDSYPITDDTIRLCQTDAIIIEGRSFDNHEWTFNDDVQTGMNYMATKSGTYYYVGSNTSGPEVEDSVYVHFMNFTLSPQDSTICKGAQIKLRVTNQGLGIFDYVWAHTSENEPIVEVRPVVTTKYRVYLVDDIHKCRDSVTVTVKEGLRVSMVQLNEVCYGSNEAQMKASVNGGDKPYTYLWNGFEVPWDSIAVGLTTGESYFSVYDQENCRFDTTYVIDAIPAPKVEVILDPDDQNVFLQNPTVQFDFEVTSDDEVVNWEWEFGDETTSTQRDPLHTYENMDADLEEGIENYNIILYTSNQYGCDTTIGYQLGMKEADVFIPNVIAPNSSNVDNHNFALYNQIRSYSDNSVGTKGAPIDYEYFNVDIVIFNRYGRVIYREANYKGDWNGNGISDGVYFYVVKLDGKYKMEEFRGAFHVFNDLTPPEE